MKVFFSFTLGLIVSFMIFHKSTPVHIPDYEAEQLKEELSLCQHNVKLAKEEISKLQHSLSQIHSEPTKEKISDSKTIASEPTESEHSDQTHEESIENHDSEKNEFVKNFKWLDHEKHVDELAKGDNASRSHFLKDVEIANLDQVMKLTERTGTQNQSFQALQGVFHGAVKDVEVKGREYQLELDVHVPPQGEGVYTLRLEGEGMHSLTRGNGKPKNFRVLKGVASKVIFIKMENVVLQLYPKANIFIGNAYKKTESGFVKFGEFELNKD